MIAFDEWLEQNEAKLSEMVPSKAVALLQSWIDTSDPEEIEDQKKVGELLQKYELVKRHAKVRIKATGVTGKVDDYSDGQFYVNFDYEPSPWFNEEDIEFL